MELGGSLVNQLRAPPFSDAENTRHKTESSNVYMIHLSGVDIHILAWICGPVILIHIQSFPCRRIG